MEKSTYIDLEKIVVIEKMRHSKGMFLQIHFDGGGVPFQISGEEAEALLKRLGKVSKRFYEIEKGK
uniref:Uncharacterized protein n=1 Tax=viral metagenome TaxID=1070528 RepID=A0A6M3JBN3_9ZZZZ